MQEHAIPTSPRRRRELATGTVASLLLHASAAALLLVNLRFEHTSAPKETTVEVVLIEKEPDAPPAPPEPPKPTPLAEAPPPDLPIEPVRPPPPQLNEAPIAERSQPPRGPGRPQARAREGAEGGGPQAAPAPQSPPAPVAPKGELSRGGGANLAALPRAGGGGEEATQDEKDFLLAQVMPFWLLDYRSPRYKHVVFRGHFVLRADGMLEPPFGKDDPWDPAAMIGGYDVLLRRDHEPQRIAIESFLKAARAAQPFRLPPGADKSKYPRAIPVFFRLGDL